MDGAFKLGNKLMIGIENPLSGNHAASIQLGQDGKIEYYDPNSPIGDLSQIKSKKDAIDDIIKNLDPTAGVTYKIYFEPTLFSATQKQQPPEELKQE